MVTSLGHYKYNQFPVPCERLYNIRKEGIWKWSRVEIMESPNLMSFLRRAHILWLIGIVIFLGDLGCIVTATYCVSFDDINALLQVHAFSGSNA